MRIAEPSYGHRSTRVDATGRDGCQGKKVQDPFNFHFVRSLGFFFAFFQSWLSLGSYSLVRRDERVMEELTLEWCPSEFHDLVYCPPP